MKIQAIKTKIFKPKDDLLKFIESYLTKIQEGSIIVVTSKIVALAEGRVVPRINEKNTSVKKRRLLSTSLFCFLS